MRTITANELKNLDSTVSSIKHFEYMGWNMESHCTEILSGMMNHLVNFEGIAPENGEDDIEAVLQELAPELF